MLIDNYINIYKEDLTLRSYQEKAKREIFESWDEVDNVMFQMPTGTGKTRLFTSIIRDINDYSKLRKEPVKILIIAHRTELIDQIDESLTKYKVPHNVIAGGRDRNYKYPVNVASIQTITHPNNLKDAKKLNVQFVIIDEAHHALATTYKKLWNLYPGSKKLGVTATPWRMNHQTFLDLFDKLVLSMPIKDFIKQGYLAPYKYFSLRSDSDIQSTIDDIELDRFGEYKESSMEEKMDIGSIRAQLLDSYLSLADGKKGIIYAINIVHAKHICEEYEKAGFKAVSIDSKTPSAERKELVGKFKRGLIDIIVNVDIFSEGFDCPDIEFIQLARPTRSLVKYLQQVGRGLRPTENKQECIILDNVGMYSRFGLPNARRHWKQHFLGKNVVEEPVKVFAKGTGKHRNVDLSEGTEDMELIQDANENQTEIIIPEDSNVSITSALNDFFPLFGVTLGKTTCEQARELGGEEKVDEDTGEIYWDIESVHFIEFHVDGILTEIYWTQNDRDFPDSWKSKGFSWDNTYNVWLEIFRRLGYKINNQRPEEFMYNGRITLDYSFYALSSDRTLQFYMKFDRVDVGSSPNKLSSIDVHYYKEPIDSRDDASEEEENVEEETYDPTRLLENFNFECNNFIFYLKQSKKIYEAYIQEDKYYIISELMIDHKDSCVRRVRVGKILSDSWMFWQMLREKTDNLKSILHYGANYTVFHYKVMSTENVENDKFFDYKGREIDNPEIIKSKYEQEISKGQITDYIDVPVSKASFKAVLEGGSYVIYRTIKGQTKQIARMPINCAFSKEYPISVYQVRIGSEIITPPNTTQRYNDVPSRILRSDEKTITVRKIEMGKGYLLKFDLKGKLLQKGTIASNTPGIVNPLQSEDFEKLKHAFDKKATSYKYFWFMSILQIYKDKQIQNISFKQILIKMIAKAWKYVFELNGQFSQTDQIPTYLLDILSLTNLKYASTELEVEEEINNNYDSLRLDLKLSSLLKNVPYRFLSSWIVFTNNDDVINKSLKSESRCPYKLHSNHITINDLWKDTLIDNYNVIELLVEYGINDYLKIDPSLMEAHDFYNKRFATLNKLLKGIKSNKEQNPVRLFLEKYNFPLTGDITPAELMAKIPESQCVIDSEGRKRINVPGDMWSLKILDKLLSDENLFDTLENVHLLEEYGLKTYMKHHQNESQELFKRRFITLTKLLKGIKNNKDEKDVKLFLEKYNFPLSGEITPAEVMAKIPEANCVIDDDGRKRVKVSGGLWSLQLLDNLLSK